MRLSHDPLSWVRLATEALALIIGAGTSTVLWLRKRSARHWPMIYGRIEHISSFENSGIWLTDISYSYTVADAYYSGQFHLTSRSEKDAEDLLPRWKDRVIQVRYSSGKPEISVVRVEDQAGLAPGEFTGVQC